MTPSTTCYILLFSFSLAATFAARVHPVVHQAQAQLRTGNVSPDIVSKACEQSSEKAFCISILKSQATGDVKDLKQATIVSIQAASGEATSTAELIKVARRREENKEVVEDGIEEETLADCCMSYRGIIERLANATNALMTGPEADVTFDLQEALLTADTCEKSIAGGRKSPQVEEVAKKNENVKKLCSNALGVFDVYSKGH